MSSVLELIKHNNRKKLPAILQSETAECGLVCLVMISKYYGLDLELTAVRRQFPQSLKGISLDRLSSIADEIGFVSCSYRLEPNELKELQSPAILHWSMNHFVVLKKVVRGGAIIVDPAGGERRVSDKEIDDCFTGVAMEVTPKITFKKARIRNRLNFTDLFSGMAGLKFSLVSLLVMSIVLQSLSMLTPLYMQNVIDNVLVGRDESLLLGLALGFAFVALFSFFVGLLRSFLIIVLSSQLGFQIAANLFNHLLRLPISYFERRHIGDVASRFSSLNYIRDQLTTTAVEVVVDGLLVIMTLVLMCYYSAYLTLIAAASIAIYLGLRMFFYHPLRKATDERIKHDAQRDSTFMESVRAIQGVKIFNKEIKRERLWHSHYANGLNASIREQRLSAVFNNINDLILGIENVLVIYLAVILVMDSEFTIGMLYAFMAYKVQFTGRATGLIDKLTEIKLVRVHLDRVADIAKAEKEEKSTGKIDEVPESANVLLNVSDVEFMYDFGDEPIFSNLSFSVKEGESVAIIGHSGCGKSTLLKIILGLRSPIRGAISLNGIDIKQYKRSTLSKSMVALMQDDKLLSGSVKENIAFFCDDYQFEKVQLAAATAGIHEEIMAMPMGYNTFIGDMGSSLSAGQQQRLLLARALFQEPKLLLLDESTSNLDVELEKRISNTIKSMRQSKLFVAHRPETILSADRILELGRTGVREISREDYKNKINSLEKEIAILTVPLMAT